MRLADVLGDAGRLKTHAHHTRPRQPSLLTRREGAVVEAFSCTEPMTDLVNPDARKDPGIELRLLAGVGCRQAHDISYKRAAWSPLKQAQGSLVGRHHRQSEHDASLVPGLPHRHKVRLTAPGQENQDPLPSLHDCAGR